MPSSKFYRRRWKAANLKYSKGIYRKNKAKYRALMMMSRRPRIPIGLPDKMATRLRYAEEVVLNADNTGICTVYELKANSLYDPNSTGAGHQYNGYDQLNAFFHRAQVLSCKATMFPILDTTTNGVAAVYGLACCNESGALSGNSIQDMYEIERNTRRYKATGIVNAICAQPYSCREAKSRYSQKKMFGKGSLDSEFSHTDASDPGSLWFFIMWCCGTVGGGEEPAAQRFIIQLEALVVFTEPKNLVAS